MAISVSVFREILSELSHENGDSLQFKKLNLKVIYCSCHNVKGPNK